MQKTTFNDIPEKIDFLLDEVQELKSILLKKTKLPKEVPKQLSLDEAILFLSEQGYKISKSSIYKKSANRTIPFFHYNGKLVFTTTELLTWCEHQQNKNNYDKK